MNVIVNTGPGMLEWREMPDPEPGPRQVRVRTLAVAICATDLEMIAGWARTGFPGVPGHEWCGEVDAVGPGVDAGLLGRRCVAENVLPDGGEVGFEHSGAYAEKLITEAGNIYPLPADFDPATGALIEPLAVCARALGRARIAAEPVKSALVIGDGPIGLITTMLLARAGVESIRLVGGREARLELALMLGASEAVNYHESAELEPGGPYDLVVEASGTAMGMEAAFGSAAAEARVVVVGDYRWARADFAWNDLLHRELELIGSNASAGAWPEAVYLAVEEALPLGELVSARMPARRFAEAVERVRSDRSVTKIVLEW